MPTHRPAPCYAAETPLRRLSTPEVFTVMALRLWAAPYRDPQGSHADWQDGFTAAGLGVVAVSAFDGLFRVIAAATQTSLDVRCPRCARLGEDEGWLLQLVCLLQRDRPAEARAILAVWLPPAAVRMALLPAEAFADCLAEAGLVLPLRHPGELEVESSVTASHGDRGLALIH